MYGSMEYRKERDIHLRAWLVSKSKIIDNIPDNYLKTLCYFSLIENFAQEYSNYYSPHKSTEMFCEFVLRFSSHNVFLDQYDPVTLYYDFEAQLKQSFDLSFLNPGLYHNPDQAFLHEKAQEMVQYLNALDTKIRSDRHKFVRLLYSLRSKLSHELINQHSMLAIDLFLLEEYPYYVSCSRTYVTEDRIERDEIWELVFPTGFIRILALECINNYLDYSLENKNDPFENNSMNRKSTKTWYDN